MLVRYSCGSLSNGVAKSSTNVNLQSKRANIQKVYRVIVLTTDSKRMVSNWINSDGAIRIESNEATQP